MAVISFTDPLRKEVISNSYYFPIGFYLAQYFKNVFFWTRIYCRQHSEHFSITTKS